MASELTAWRCLACRRIYRADEYVREGAKCRDCEGGVAWVELTPLQDEWEPKPSDSPVLQRTLAAIRRMFGARALD